MTSRYFFVHCQKTAGTSLMAQLSHQFKPGEICPSETLKKQDAPMAILSLKRLETYLDNGGENIRVVSGHFPYCTREMLAKKLGPKIRTFTILRDPVERTLSFLRHTKKLTPELRDASLREIYNDEIRFHGLIHNHMVKMFALPYSAELDTIMTHIDFTDAHLERAKFNLRRVNVVGLQENYGRFCKALESKFNWDLGTAKFVNETKKTQSVSPQLIKRIQADNALDMRFYNFAKRHVEQRQAKGRQV